MEKKITFKVSDGNKPTTAHRAQDKQKEFCITSQLYTAVLLRGHGFQLSLSKHEIVKAVQQAGDGFCLPDSLDVHGLRVPQPLPAGGRSRRGRRVATLGLARSKVGRVVMVVVWSVHVAVVQEQRRVCLRGVHTLHGGVHVINQLLQVHVIICGGKQMAGWERWRRVEKGELQDSRYPLDVTSVGISLRDYFKYGHLNKIK